MQASAALLEGAPAGRRDDAALRAHPRSAGRRQSLRLHDADDFALSRSARFGYPHPVPTRRSSDLGRWRRAALNPGNDDHAFADGQRRPHRERGRAELNASRPKLPGTKAHTIPHPPLREEACKLPRHFSRALRPAGVMTLPFGLTLAPPGGANHFGCTMPMTSRSRARLDSDILTLSLHDALPILVDGAVLPSIPATTITLLQMANADRIASAAELS